MGCFGVGGGDDNIIELVRDPGLPHLAQVRTCEVQHVKMRMKPVLEETGIPLFIFARDTENLHLRGVELSFTPSPMGHHPSNSMP